MKLLPKEPTPEMWERLGTRSGITKNLNELEGAINTRNSHVAESFCGATYAAAPEVKEEQVLAIQTQYERSYWPMAQPVVVWLNTRIENRCRVRNSRPIRQPITTHSRA